MDIEGAKIVVILNILFARVCIVGRAQALARHRSHIWAQDNSWNWPSSATLWHRVIRPAGKGLYVGAIPLVLYRRL